MSKLATGFYMLAVRGYLKWLPDKTFLKIQYRLSLHKKLNLKNPKTFTEKLQWMKLYDKNPVYTAMADKYAVKEYVAEKIGEEHLIPTLGVWDSFNDIDFSKLPRQFVLKCTHDSGSIVICKNKADFNIKAAKKKIDKHLKMNHYNAHREWPYKYVKPRIIAEKYLEQEDGAGLIDYKFFCFNGNPLFLYVSQMSHSRQQKLQFFDIDYKPLEFSRFDYKPFQILPPKPSNFDEMVSISKKLARDISSPFVRIDLYSISGQIYFSEITFTPCSGLLSFEPEEWDKKLGQMWDLAGHNETQAGQM